MFSKSYAISTPTPDSLELELAEPILTTLEPTPNVTEVNLMDQDISESTLVQADLNLNQSTSVTTLQRKESDSTIARAFFSGDFQNNNNNENQSTISGKTSTTSKRHSLPLPIGGSRSASLFSSTSTVPSLIPKTRKSTSPRHSRTSLSSSISSLSAITSSSANGSLLIAPLTTQLHSLKARNRALESLLIQEKEGRISDLGKARGRIENLEKVLQGSERVLEGRSKEKLEADGWESEVLVVREELVGAQTKATELQSQVEGLELAFKVEKDKRYRSKQIVERLRLELRARRCAERWEIGIIDIEDRRREVDEVGLEFEVGMLRMQVLVDKVEREDLEAIIAERDQRILKLSSTRAQLDKANETIATLRTELSTSKSDLATLRKASSLLEKEVNNLAKKSSDNTSKADAKELSELKRSLEKEKKLREAEIKELKSSLKQTQVELKTSVSKKLISYTAVKSKKSTSSAPLPSVSTLAARKRRSMTRERSEPVSAAEESGDDADEEGFEDVEMEAGEDGDSSAVMLKAEAKARALERVISSKKGSGETKGKKVKVSRPVTPEVDSDEEDEVEEEVEEEETEESVEISVELEEESYKPTPKKSKAATSGASSKATKSKSKILADSTTSTVSKKRKASIGGGTSSGKVLTETKSGNNDGVVAMKEKKALIIVKKASAGTEKEEVPAKKKQRKLFAGTSKFQWGGIENANINGLIPSNLSPIKTGSAATGLASVFGGTKGLLGRSIY